MLAVASDLTVSEAVQWLETALYLGYFDDLETEEGKKQLLKHIDENIERVLDALEAGAKEVRGGSQD